MTKAASVKLKRLKSFLRGAPILLQDVWSEIAPSASIGFDVTSSLDLLLTCK